MQAGSWVWDQLPEFGQTLSISGTCTSTAAVLSRQVLLEEHDGGPGKLGGICFEREKASNDAGSPQGTASSNPGEGGEVPGTVRHSRRDGSIAGTSC